MASDESRLHSPDNGKALHEAPPLSERITPAGGHRIWPWLVVFVVIAGGAYLLYWRIHAMDQLKGANPARVAAGRPIPVVVAPVRTGELNVFYEGLGTVTAEQTV